MTQPEPRQTASPAKRRRWAFRALAVLLGVLPFVLLEFVLAAFDLGSPQEHADPFVGYSSVRPLFELDEQRGVYHISPSRSLFFGRQEFARKKPANGFRMFCLGGSTVRGRPYETDSAFLKWLELELQDRDPLRKYESVNCGGLSYASYRLVHVLQEVLQYEPDLIIVATGHNEFLEDRSYAHIRSRSAARAWVEDRLHSLRTVTLARQAWHVARGSASATSTTGQSGRTVLPDKVETSLDNRSGYASYHWDADWREGVVRHFRFSLERMVGMCRKADVPLVLVNVGMNLRDCPPFKSEHTRPLSPEEELRWRDLFDQASAVETSEPEAALRLYYAAEGISDGYALLSWRIARCLDRLGRSDAARPYYGRAKELDVCPLRALDAVNQIVREVAEETATPLVDARALLEGQSPQHIPGYDWYVDHVHPSPGGHQQIAAALAAKLQELEIPERLPEWSAERRRVVYRRRWEELGPVFLADGARRVTWLENWAQRNRLLEETLPVTSEDFLRVARKHWNFDETEVAWQACLAAVELEPDSTAKIVATAAELVGEGRAEAARGLLARLAELETDRAIRRLIALGQLVTAVELGDREAALKISAEHGEEVKAALQSASRWRELMPDVVERTQELRAGTR